MIDLWFGHSVAFIKDPVMKYMFPLDSFHYLIMISLYCFSEWWGIGVLACNISYLSDCLFTILCPSIVILSWHLRKLPSKANSAVYLDAQKYREKNIFVCFFSFVRGTGLRSCDCVRESFLIAVLLKKSPPWRPQEATTNEKQLEL